MQIPNLPIKMISRSSGSSGLLVFGLIAALVVIASRKPKQLAQS
jgi:hypothetical protein